MQSTNPEFIYHYTTVEVLALILDSGKMKFSPLNTVDDKEETKTENLEDAGKYCFVCCFTGEEKESIPIWHMYSAKGSGIRLKIPNKKESFEDPENNVNQSTLSASATIVNNNGTLEGTSLGNYFELIEVKYTDDKALIRPNIEIGDGGETNINIMKDLGKHKNSYWEFQKEWRFIKFALPTDSSGALNNQNICYNYLYISLTKEVIKNMEITLGYNISYGNELIVNQLVDNYNQKEEAHINIVESCLVNRVR